MGIPYYGQNKDGDALDKALNGGYGDYAGADLADSTDAVAMNASDFGKTFLCLLDGAAKTVTLPANVGEADIGKQIKIVQKVSLVGSGVLTISCGAGNKLSPNSIFYGVGCTVFRPGGATHNTITITGAATNSLWGENSVATITVVDSGKYMVELDGRNIGSGSDGIATSAV